MIAASRKLELLKPEDRAVKLAKRLAKKNPGTPAAGGEEKAAPKKPRSGRPLTPRALASATNGKALTGPQKTRLVRAVNYVLSQKKKDAVELKTLF
ncbi:MAG: hypothetical protein QM756_41620 [Polyangiaceae bacterium]